MENISAAEQKLIEQRERHRRLLPHSTAEIPPQGPREPDYALEVMLRDAADEMLETPGLAERLEAWAARRIADRGRELILELARVPGNHAVLHAYEKARGELNRRAASPQSWPEDIKECSVFAVFAFAAEHVASDDYHDERLGR